MVVFYFLKRQIFIILTFVQTLMLYQMMLLFINEIHFCLFLKVSIYKCDNGGYWMEKTPVKFYRIKKSDISRNKIYILFLGKKYQKLKAFSQTYFWSNDVIECIIYFVTWNFANLTNFPAFQIFTSGILLIWYKISN